MTLSLITATEAKAALAKAKTILSGEITNSVALDAILKLLREQRTPYRIIVLKS